LTEDKDSRISSREGFSKYSNYSNNKGSGSVNSITAKEEEEEDIEFDFLYDYVSFRLLIY
jgi:hypothetical protein